jgi:hypothetical protein
MDVKTYHETRCSGTWVFWYPIDWVYSWYPEVLQTIAGYLVTLRLATVRLNFPRLDPAAWGRGIAVFHQLRGGPRDELYPAKQLWCRARQYRRKKTRQRQSSHNSHVTPDP